jgi:hypothetical protein
MVMASMGGRFIIAAPQKTKGSHLLHTSSIAQPQETGNTLSTTALDSDEPDVQAPDDGFNTQLQGKKFLNIVYNIEIGIFAY